MDPVTHNVTNLLKAWSGGDQDALAALTPKVYEELRRMAAKYMRNEHAGNTLQATALVHEVFLKLVEVEQVHWKDRAHFFAISATMMRRILVDRARSKGRAKRGGAVLKVSLEEDPQVTSLGRDRELVAIDDALSTLAGIDPRKAKVIELRFFGGLSVAETAEVLKISPESVARDWKMARAWLLAEITN
jgi:RNA polymerase sigma-70 factor, ECF subfamily